MLVAAVLRPEQREDGELEVVRLPLEQFVDTGVLPVCKTELTVDGLFRDGAQDLSLAAPPDGHDHAPSRPPSQPRRAAHLPASSTGRIVRETPSTSAQSSTESAYVPSGACRKGT